jgi:hypothetical protein
MTARSLFATALATLLAACGSSSTSTSSGTAKMNVRLVDAPSPGYDEVNIDVRTVEIASDSGWTTLGNPNKVVNLLALTDGVYETLVDGATLPAGHYGQMRLILGPNNTVKPTLGTPQPLTVPSGQQSGVKLSVNFDVQAGTTADVFIDIDAHKSVFVHQAGASNKYILRPTVRAYDKLVTGSISGTLSNGSGTLPEKVFVFAETVGTNGPTIAMSTVTTANGHYFLGLLPMKDASGQDIAYHVVSQPVVRDGTGAATASYAALASTGIVLTQAAPTATWNATFALVEKANTGSAKGSISTVADENQGDVVLSRTLVPVGDGSTSSSFIVRSTPVDVSGATEPYTVDALPVTPPSTSYDFAAERTATNPLTQVATTVLTPWSTAPVPADGIVTVPAFAF